MSLKNRDIQGSANISRNVNVGNNANVNGDVTVGHNLRVTGWVDAPNIKGPLKGLYASEEALKEAYPKPEAGWFALVGDRLPAAIWRAELKHDTDESGGPSTPEGEWRATGETGGTLNLYQDFLERGIRNLKDGIDDEAEARETADDALWKSVATIQGTIELEELDDMYGPALVLKKAGMEGNGPFRFIVMRNGRNSGFVDVIGDSMGHNLTQILTTHEAAPDFTMHTDERVHIYIRTYVLNKGTLPEAKGTWTEWRSLISDLLERDSRTDLINGQAFRTGDSSGISGYFGSPTESGAVFFTGADNDVEAGFAAYKDGRTVATDMHISGRSTFRGTILKQKTVITKENYPSFLTSVDYNEELGREELDLTKTGTWIEIMSLPPLILKGQLHLPGIKAGTEYSDTYKDYVRQFVGTELMIYNSWDRTVTVYAGDSGLPIPSGGAIRLKLECSPERTAQDSFFRETIKWDYTDPFLF